MIDLTSQIEKLRIEENMYNKLIGEFLTRERSSNSRKKDVELQDLASLVIAMNYADILNISDVKIVEVREEPDFVIQVKSKTIGIELTKLHTGDVQKYGSQKELLSKSAELFAKKYAGIKLLASIELDNELPITKEKSSQFHSEICEAVYSKYSKSHFAQPTYIKRLSIMPHTGVDFELMGAFWVPNLKFSLINEAISNKEPKIEKYRSNIDVDEIWLVPFISGASPESSYNEIVKDCEIMTSSFNNIYVLDVYKKLILPIK